MRKLAIIHFNPVELYPPALNWLNFLGDRGAEAYRVKVFTMYPSVTPELFSPGSGNVKICRSGTAGRKGMMAYYNYFRFYIKTIWQLIRWKPDTVLYYETLSSLPVFLYKKYVRRKARLFIHCHEYTSAKEYEQGGPLVRWVHELEKKLYPLAEWISHTNEDRIGLFEKDLDGIVLPPITAFPNYPPASWQERGREDRPIGAPLKLVYVGALSLETMYTKELAEWIMGQDGRVTWDIYSDNITEDAKKYLQSLDNGPICFKKAVNYYRLPDILARYDVGVILYKGHIPNYIYNAPNKLFEYKACGLDVWFPDVMKSSLSFVTKDIYPKVTAIDFNNLPGLDIREVTGRNGLKRAPSLFYCESIFDKMLNKMNATESPYERS